jgi:hypothetical protein
MVYFIWNTFDVAVSESAITRLLKRKKWSRKTVKSLFLNAIQTDDF